VLSVVFAVALLDEDPSGVQLAGIAVVVSGILLATVGRSPPLPDNRR
jgi:drug/metabolite transporter (DMT)-like permease